MAVPQLTIEAFGGSGPAERLSAHAAVYKCGELVFKRCSPNSLENDRSLELLPWLAQALVGVATAGFRIAQPVPTNDGRWLSAGAWTASRFVPGRPAGRADVSEVLSAIHALHASLVGIPKHPALDTNASAWGRAHRECWGSMPAGIEPLVAPLLAELYARLKPLPTLPAQLVHGDLHSDNVLIAPGHPPAFLDFTPFWAPVGFAVAMFANWVGPRSGDTNVLSAFEHEPHFEQLLLRAAVRMLLVVSHLGGVAEWSTERRAAELVLRYVDRSQAR